MENVRITNSISWLDNAFIAFVSEIINMSSIKRYTDWLCLNRNIDVSFGKDIRIKLCQKSCCSCALRWRETNSQAISLVIRLFWSYLPLTIHPVNNNLPSSLTNQGNSCKRFRWDWGEANNNITIIFKETSNRFLNIGWQWINVSIITVSLNSKLSRIISEDIISINIDYIGGLECPTLIQVTNLEVSSIITIKILDEHDLRNIVFG